MDNKKLNEKLRMLICDEMNDNLIGILKSQPHKTLCLDDDKKDPIYGYYYDPNGMVVEQQVKGITLSADEKEIFVYLDYHYIAYTLEDLLDKNKVEEESWFNLFSSELLGWFTMININEVVDEYL